MVQTGLVAKPNGPLRASDSLLNISSHDQTSISPEARVSDTDQVNGGHPTSETKSISISICGGFSGASYPTIQSLQGLDSDSAIPSCVTSQAIEVRHIVDHLTGAADGLYRHAAQRSSLIKSSLF